MRTLITTIFEGGAVLAAINKLSPDKLVIIVPDPIGKERKKAIEQIKKNFSYLKIETLKTELYDIPKIVADVCKIIEKEHKSGNEISIHMSESRKTQALGAYFAGLLCKNKIKGVFYIEEESGHVLPLPLLNFKLSKTKTMILKEINKGNKDIPSIIKKSGKEKSIIYQHIKALKADGYITDDLELTDSGRIVVL